MKDNDTIIFKALSDVNRINIIKQLQKGEQCACVLMKKLNLTQSGLSYHMKMLMDSNLVIGKEEGKWVYYSLNKVGIQYTISLLEEISVFKSQRIEGC